MDMREEQRRGDRQLAEDEAELQPNWNPWAKDAAKNVRKVVMVRLGEVPRQEAVM